jgi:hypothetical protein
MMNRRSRIALLALVIAAFGSGCGEERANAAPGAQSAQAKQATTAPRSTTYTVPAGTTVLASLGTHLSTDANQTGDPFVATTSEAIVVNGTTVVPAGAQVRGVLQNVQSSGRVKGRAGMTLAFQQIVDARGQSHAVSVQPLVLLADSKTTSDVEKIAAGGVVAGVIGGIAGGKKGAVIGVGAGAGAGTILMLATKGDDIELHPGQALNIHITSATSMTLGPR